jgi:hypothetical protein
VGYDTYLQHTTLSNVGNTQHTNSSNLGNIWPTNYSNFTNIVFDRRPLLQPMGTATHEESCKDGYGSDYKDSYGDGYKDSHAAESQYIALVEDSIIQ